MVADRPALLLAQDLGYAVGEDGAMTPTVVLHVDEHPEVADLARVHAIEGIGDVRTTGRRVDNAGPGGAPVFLLGVSLTSPCLLYTSPSPRDRQKSRMPSSS